MSSIIVTGDKELDRALGKFEAKVQKKYIRKALNSSIKIVEKEYKERVPVGTNEDGEDTGVMRDATKRRTPKRKRNTQGRSLVIDRELLMTLYFQRYGKFPGKRNADKEPFFYPAVIELGGIGRAPERPMRASLYGNEAQVKAEFVRALQEAVKNAPTEAAGGQTNSELRSAAVARGDVAYRDVSKRLQWTTGGFAGLKAARARGFTGD